MKNNGRLSINILKFWSTLDMMDDNNYKWRVQRPFGWGIASPTFTYENFPKLTLIGAFHGDVNNFLEIVGDGLQLVLDGYEIPYSRYTSRTDYRLTL